jgi:hypothetical protein
MAMGSMWILKEAVERAGVADKVKIGETIHSIYRMEIEDGPAAMAYPGPFKFDAGVIVQWANRGAGHGLSGRAGTSAVASESFGV